MGFPNSFGTQYQGASRHEVHLVLLQRSLPRSAFMMGNPSIGKDESILKWKRESCLCRMTSFILGRG